MKTIDFADRELLLSLKRFCTEKNCFRNAKLDEMVLDYYKGTMKMVDEELEDGRVPDADRVETIVSNILTVMSNVSLYFDKKSKGHLKNPITFITTDVECARVCRFLDESTGITARYEACEAKRKNMKRADIVQRRKVVRVLKRVLMILLIIGTLPRVLVDATVQPIYSVMHRTSPLF